jgi:hypothetical protein
MNSFSPSATLEAIYSSEINFEFSTFWAAGFKWRLGDPANGYHAEGNAETFDEAVQQLANAARRHFPRSAFSGERKAGEQVTDYRSKCRACFEESGRPGPLLPAKGFTPEFELLLAARRKCPNCGKDVVFERVIPSAEA